MSDVNTSFYCPSDFFLAEFIRFYDLRSINDSEGLAHALMKVDHWNYPEEFCVLARYLESTTDDICKRMALGLLECVSCQATAMALSSLAISMNTPPCNFLLKIALGEFCCEAQIAAIHALGYSYCSDTRKDLEIIACDLEKRGTLRGHALEALGNIGNWRSIPALRRLAESDKTSAPIAFWVAYALGEIGGNKAKSILGEMSNDARPALFGKTVSEEANESISAIDGTLR